jgi:hypothetical protein
MSKPTRYFLVHGLKTGDFDAHKILDYKPWLAEVLKFDHFPRLDELRRALALACGVVASNVRITGWSEVTKEEARIYLDEGDAEEHAAITSRRYTASDEGCVIL